MEKVAIGTEEINVYLNTRREGKTEIQETAEFKNMTWLKEVARIAEAAK